MRSLSFDWLCGSGSGWAKILAGSKRYWREAKILAGKKIRQEEIIRYWREKDTAGSLEAEAEQKILALAGMPHLSLETDTSCVC